MEKTKDGPNLLENFELPLHAKIHPPPPLCLPFVPFLPLNSSHLCVRRAPPCTTLCCSYFHMQTPSYAHSFLAKMPSW